MEHGRRKTVFTVSSALFLLLFILGCAEEKQPSIVIIMIDTLRADHMGCYGYPKNTTPNIDGFARQGVVFTDLVAAAPSTGPSVTSILTGKYPDEVGVHKNCDPLSNKVNMLAERLKKKGYATGAVIANPVAGPLHGFNQGYDFFCSTYKKKKKDRDWEAEATPKDGTYFKANYVTNITIDWINKQEKPFFLYVHYMDPHVPYLPPYKWRDKMLGDAQPLNEEILRNFKFGPTGKKAISESDMKRMRAQYEGEIAFTDNELSRLFNALDSNTFIVLTGDHGEGFLEHGNWRHANSLYQELLHVPLIIKGPGVPQNKRVDFTVSHVDITPTILDFVGAKGGRVLAGQSLLPIIETPKEKRKDRALFSILKLRKQNSTSAKTGPWKLILDEKKSNVRLFNIEIDPMELHNLMMQNMEIATPLLDKINSRKSKIVPPKEVKDPAIKKEIDNVFRRLGYIK